MLWGMQIRRARSGDRAGLVELVQRFYRVDGHEFDCARVESGLLPLLRDDSRGQVWVAEDDDGGLAGYAVVTWSWSLESGGLDCILDEIYVHKKGEGFGSLLLRRAVDEAAAIGAAAMFLETEAPNDGARRFYARHDFAAEDSIWMSRPLR